jgi:hypothetical protein
MSSEYSDNMLIYDENKNDNIILPNADGPNDTPNLFGWYDETHNILYKSGYINWPEFKS